ncbi:glutamate--cysteine ligase [Nocardioides sp.]|uniref:glutamate--cysteine ligase n=1 Tax=Nocardioides sp. TaxID=35761 RepID=UPI003783E984
MVRTVGLEEELLLLDRRTREVVPAAPRVLKEFREHGRGRDHASVAADGLTPELFRHQLETRTDPGRDAADLHAQLVAARRTAGEAAAAAGLALAACGMVPLGGDQSVVSPDDRYRDMVDTYGEVARTGGTCGMHVHVAITSEEEGVAVLDRIAPWLPVLLALSANSPYAEGRDTGYASWRAQVWSRWPSAGPTEQFGSLEGYRAACRTMLASGAARDPGMLYFDARLSVGQPTVEVRVCDVCTDPDEAMVVAVLVRALVETAAREARAGRPAPAWRSEELRVAHWRAARYGVADRLVHPLRRELRPAREVLDDLVGAVGPALVEAGDAERVSGVLSRVVGDGGATRQRAAFERSGSVAGVVDDLIARTEATWHAPERL